jgi:hypothetical protein
LTFFSIYPAEIWLWLRFLTGWFSSMIRDLLAMSAHSVSDLIRKKEREWKFSKLDTTLSMVVSTWKCVGFVFTTCEHLKSHHYGKGTGSNTWFNRFCFLVCLESLVDKSKLRTVTFQAPSSWNLGSFPYVHLDFTTLLYVAVSLRQWGSRGVVFFLLNDPNINVSLKERDQVSKISNKKAPIAREKASSVTDNKANPRQKKRIVDKNIAALNISDQNFFFYVRVFDVQQITTFWTVQEYHHGNGNPSRGLDTHGEDLGWNSVATSFPFIQKGQNRNDRFSTKESGLV